MHLLSTFGWLYLATVHAHIKLFQKQKKTSEIFSETLRIVRPLSCSLFSSRG